MRIRSDIIKSIILFTPHTIIYILLVYLSMNFAADRESYLNFFENPYSGERFEYFYVLLGKFLNFLGFNNISSILFIQFFTILLYFKLFINLSKNNKLILLSFMTVFLFTVFSNPLGVQIRYGFAIAVLLFFYSYLKGNRFVYQIAYIVPALLHYGTIPFILFAVISNSKQFIGKGKLIPILILLIILLPIVTSNIVNIINLDIYYITYFDGSFKNAPEISLTLLYLLFASLINFKFERKKVDWLPYAGLMFAIGSIVTGVDLLLKLMMPFIVLSTVDLFNNLYRVKFIIKEYFPFLYLCSFISFLYYYRMVSLF
jgi:hypothetical protein